MHTKSITFMGQPAVLACDGNCGKAWGINHRPKLELSEDPDDVAFLADDEAGEAPTFPGTYEGGCGKPRNPAGMNKWCARECERSTLAPTEGALKLPDYSRRLFNQPWKHEQAPAESAQGGAR